MSEPLTAGDLSELRDWLDSPEGPSIGRGVAALAILPRLLATLDAANPAPGDIRQHALDYLRSNRDAKPAPAGLDVERETFHKRITATMGSPSIAAWESIALDLFDALATAQQREGAGE